MSQHSYWKQKEQCNVIHGNHAHKKSELLLEIYVTMCGMEKLIQLNAAQQSAVEAPLANRLVLAGAGSGKTRVLVQRIAWLMQEHHVSPQSVLAVTFTNKAAQEMRSRIEEALNQPMHHLWVGTFHGIAHRLLRMHWQAANLPEAFQIIDADDQKRMIKRLQKNMNLDEQRWPPKQTQWYISQQKQQGIRATQAQTQAQSYFDETLSKVYAAYEQHCQQTGLVDFTELLLAAYELLEKNPELKTHYQERFRYILVDEFQDTNAIQYQWIKSLTTPDHVLMAVGDDDQSIYSWRGANSGYIQRFCDDFPGAEIIRLEQNYRSTQYILTAANTIIANNTHRLGKELWTERGQGELIRIYAAHNDRDETYFVISDIEKRIAAGRQGNDIVILYRSNAQSRVFEERLLDIGLPYRIHGGQRFFERAEVKDTLAYLRVLQNRHDDAAFERIVNLPTRGIGHTTLNHLREVARQAGQSLWDTMLNFVAEEAPLSKRATNALANFQQLIDQMHEAISMLSLPEQVCHVLQHSGLQQHFQRDKSEQGLSRVENLDELVHACEQYEHTDDLLTPLTAFLAQVTLNAGDEKAADREDVIHLMTLHAAKGLEFPVVYIVGMEEGLFPHQMSSGQAHGLEEERRLCYVGMTRAMEQLTLSYAEVRRLHGQERYCQASRFMRELPEHCCDHLRPSSRSQAATGQSSHYREGHNVGNTNLRVGANVSHPKFGCGVISNTEGSGEATRVEVCFERFGKKWLVLSYAKLTPL